MKNPRSLLSLLLVAGLNTLAACGDADGPGEFSYIFYVVVLEDGEEVATYLDAS